MDSSQFLDGERRFDERIKSAIKKGKQTSLAGYIKDINLSKFEHNGDDGPLVVFAEKLSYPFGLLGNYKMVRNCMKPNVDTYQQLVSVQDASSRKKLKAEKVSKLKQSRMLDGKERSGVVNGLSEKSDFEKHNSLKKELRLPKLRSGSMRQGGGFHHGNYKSSDPVVSKNPEFLKKTDLLPQLPAKQYIDNFRRDATEFERRLMFGKSRANPIDKRMSKGVKIRENLLPKIDEKMTVFPLTSNDKVLTKDTDHIRLPKLKDDGLETSSTRKKRKPARNEDAKMTTRQDAKRGFMSHNERKAAAQKEQAKWCRKTMQSNSYI